MQDCNGEYQSIQSGSWACNFKLKLFSVATFIRAASTVRLQSAVQGAMSGNKICGFSLRKFCWSALPPKIRLQDPVFQSCHGRRMVSDSVFVTDVIGSDYSRCGLLIIMMPIALLCCCCVLLFVMPVLTVASLLLSSASAWQLSYLIDLYLCC